MKMLDGSLKKRKLKKIVQKKIEANSIEWTKNTQKFLKEKEAQHIP